MSPRAAATEPVVENDPLTGLPPLYDDLLWRVSRTPSKDPFHHYTVDPEVMPAAWLQVVQPNVAVEKNVRKKKRISGRTFTVTETVVEDKVLFEEPIALIETIKVPDEYSAEASAEFKKALAAAKKKVGPGAVEGHKHFSDEWWHQTSYKVVIDPTVNPATILRTAHVLYEVMLAKRVADAQAEEARLEKEHQAKVAQLERERIDAERNRWVGDYPPRSLNTK